MLTGFLLGVLLSALVYEVSFYLLYHQTPWRGAPDVWKQELFWFGVTGILAAISFYTPWFAANLRNSFWLWPGVFALSASGWFLGDLVREVVQQRTYAAGNP